MESSHPTATDGTSMPMFFVGTSRATLWFQSWETKSSGMYALSIIGLILFGMAHEALSAFSTSYTRSAQGSSSSGPKPREGSQAGKSRSMSLTLSQLLTPHRVIISLLYCGNLTTGYLLMLALMTMNAGYFVAVICGRGLGHHVWQAQAHGSSHWMKCDVCGVKMADDEMHLLSDHQGTHSPWSSTNPIQQQWASDAGDVEGGIQGIATVKKPLGLSGGPGDGSARRSTPA